MKISEKKEAGQSKKIEEINSILLGHEFNLRKNKGEIEAKNNSLKEKEILIHELKRKNLKL